MSNTKAWRAKREKFLRDHAFEMRSLMCRPFHYNEANEKWIEEVVRPALGYAVRTHPRDIWRTLEDHFKRLKL